MYADSGHLDLYYSRHLIDELGLRLCAIDYWLLAQVDRQALSARVADAKMPDNQFTAQEKAKLLELPWLTSDHLMRDSRSLPRPTAASASMLRSEPSLEVPFTVAIQTTLQCSS